MKKISIILLAILFFWFVIHNDTKNENKINKAGLEDLDLQLVGVVDTVIKGSNYHDFGIIRLNIISSNIQEYDPRTNQKYYFCIIKNGIAEMYDHTLNELKGDTLMYQSKLRLRSYLRNGKKEEEGSISINATEDYYNFIRRHTIFR